MRFRILLSLAALLTAALSSCSETSPLIPVDGTGSVRVEARFPSANGARSLNKASAQDFVTGEVTFSRPTATLTLPLTISGARAEVTAPSLKSGKWDITVRFYNASGVVTFEGAGSVQLNNGGSVSVSVAVSPKGSSVTVGLDLPVTTLINRMDSATSELGASFTAVGNPSAVPAVFGNGLQLNESQYLEGSLETMTDHKQGAFEFWFTPQWNLSNKNGQYRTLSDSSSIDNRFHLVFSDLNNFHINAFGAGAQIAETSLPVAITAGTPVHFALVWKAAGIDGSADTLRLYMNGQLALASQGALNPNAVAQTLYLGKHGYLGVAGAQGIFDNLKIHGYAKTDYSDRIEE